MTGNLATWASLSLAFAWGLFAAPRAPVALPLVAAVVRVLFFGGAALALAAARHPWLGATLIALVVVNSVLVHPLPADGQAAATAGAPRPIAASAPSPVTEHGIAPGDVACAPRGHR